MWRFRIGLWLIALGANLMPERLEVHLKDGIRTHDKIYGDKVMPIMVDAMQDSLKA
jgi:hypothetical protein